MNNELIDIIREYGPSIIAPGIVMGIFTLLSVLMFILLFSGQVSGDEAGFAVAGLFFGIIATVAYLFFSDASAAPYRFLEIYESREFEIVTQDNGRMYLRTLGQTITNDANGVPYEIKVERKSTFTLTPFDFNQLINKLKIAEAKQNERSQK